MHVLGCTHNPSLPSAFLSCSSRSERSLEGTVKPKTDLFTFSSRLSPSTPFPFPRENSMAKLPGFSRGQALPYFRTYLCLARQRGQYPGPIKVNGNQSIRASLDLAGRACSRVLAKPSPVSIQLNCSSAKLPRSWLLLLARRCPPIQESLVTLSSWNRSCTSLLPPCKEPETSFHLLAPPQQIKVLRGRRLAG